MTFSALTCAFLTHPAKFTIGRFIHMLLSKEPKNRFQKTSAVFTDSTVWQAVVCGLAAREEWVQGMVSGGSDRHHLFMYLSISAGPEQRSVCGVKLLQKQITDKNEHSACNAVCVGPLLSRTTIAFINSEDCCLPLAWTGWMLVFISGASSAWSRSVINLMSQQPQMAKQWYNCSNNTFQHIRAPPTLRPSAPCSKQWENAMNTSELIKGHIFATCRGGSSVTVAAIEITQSKTMNPLRILSINSAYIQQFNHLLNSLFSLA